ncbi:DHA2 family efflux MFS transporter permease subunit [Nocardioides jiangxiensis]|uniref:DHA2 family efflux MFS transporter permease subunit n=1 Tax=Nocardioides jiangxiensis TaxID=3064524 RepID=A0ABT9B2U1_9ACTN|nr:DHA2 family efflux MFS transporter permease subunit [Nocardioides sp. WY-20]MDO7867932.1 DHA2 family efflux MFS transporter permease subunit [Nocardioides sp. WY-20]
MTSQDSAVQTPPTKDPWPALWALVLGFFMIMVDTTIVSVATPAIIEDLHAEVNSVVWVTSAYLLAYAVPVLITGRLGDRFGPKNLYMIGLAVFTAASLWCGLAGSVESLVVARIVQGLGASMITPQTMAIITRIFPAERRGQATALWGATAGVALLVGPLLGGVLIDSLDWSWIFFVNVPVGLIGLVLAFRLVPRLQTHDHHFDWLGVVLSGVGMFLLVFGIQEGHRYDWGTVTGFVSVPLMIGGGLVVLALFVLWQARNKAEPLVPLGLFGDRNFSLANLGIATVSFAFTAIGFPLMLWAQVVRGLNPTHAALLLVPMALMSILLAPGVGRLTDRVHPRNLIAVGFATLAGAMLWLALGLAPDAKYAVLLIPMALMGCGSACIWAPLTATATRNLPLHLAGAGAGVYNASRQIGAVLGSAAIAVLMDARLSANNVAFDPTDTKALAQMAQATAEQKAVFFDHFSTSMGQSLLVTPAVLLLGFAAALLLIRPKAAVPGAAPVLVD